MNKSELKKRILESLTPDEASKVDVKYKEIYAGMVGKNPLKMKKYDNPDKVAYGRAINLIKKESAKLSEKLGKDADLGDHIEDFQKSDAPQFQGKSQKKINQMATAAFLKKEEQKLDEIDDIMEDAQDKSEENYSNYFKKMDKNKLEEFVKEALKNPKKADLNKDNKLSDYEKARATAIEKSIDKVDEDLLKKGGKISKALDALDRAAEEAALSGEQFKTLMAAFNKEMGLAETAEIGDYPGKTKNNIKANVKSVKTFADEILRHIDVVTAEEPQGDQYLENPNIDRAIKNLEKVAGDKEDEEIVDESFDSLAKDLDKQKGVDKEYAGKIAGKIANIKRKGGGKGPTAKQKKRMAETILKELRK